MFTFHQEHDNISISSIGSLKAVYIFNAPRINQAIRYAYAFPMTYFKNPMGYFWATVHLVKNI